MLFKNQPVQKKIKESIAWQQLGQKINLTPSEWMGGIQINLKVKRRNLPILITTGRLKINWLMVSMRISGDSHNVSINMSWWGKIQRPTGASQRLIWVLPSSSSCANEAMEGHKPTHKLCFKTLGLLGSQAKWNKLKCPYGFKALGQGGGGVRRAKRASCLPA